MQSKAVVAFSGTVEEGFELSERYGTCSFGPLGWFFHGCRSMASLVLNKRKGWFPIEYIHCKNRLQKLLIKRYIGQMQLDAES